MNKKNANIDECSSIVVGRLLNISGVDFLRKAKVLLEEEQLKISPDTCLIAFICDAVCLWREYEDTVKGKYE